MQNHSVTHSVTHEDRLMFHRTHNTSLRIQIFRGNWLHLTTNLTTTNRKCTKHTQKN